MKTGVKAIVSAVIAVIVLGIIIVTLPAQTREDTEVFLYDNGYNTATLGLNGEEGTFSFNQSFLADFMEQGTYAVSGLRIDLQADNGNHYSFLRMGKYLFFLQWRSSEVVRYKFKPEDVDGKKAIRNFGVFVLQKQ